MLSCPVSILGTEVLEYKKVVLYSTDYYTYKWLPREAAESNNLT